MKKRYVVLLTALSVCFVFVFSISFYLFEAVLARNGTANMLVVPTYIPVANIDSFSNEVSINNDGLDLFGYTMEQDSNTWVIVVHGYNTGGTTMNWASNEFYKMGYNILAIDLRGHGKSDGDFIGLGWLDQHDIVRWVEFLEEYDDGCDIVLYGVSMGATAIMNAASLGLSDSVKVVIEDSGFSEAWSLFKYHMQETFTVPTFPFLNVTNLIVKLRLGFSLKSGPIQAIENNEIPIMFIHGTQDSLIPISMVDELYEACNSDKELYIIEGAGHVESNEIDKSYWNKIHEFINKYGL